MAFSSLMCILVIGQLTKSECNSYFEAEHRLKTIGNEVVRSHNGCFYMVVFQPQKLALKKNAVFKQMIDIRIRQCFKSRASMGNISYLHICILYTTCCFGTVNMSL